MNAIKPTNTIKIISCIILAAASLAANAVSFNNTHALIGLYKPANATLYRFMLATQNPQTGVWEQQTNFNDIPEAERIMSNSIACVGSQCFMPGKIQLSGNDYWNFLGLHSEDAGKTWSANTTFNHLPGDFKNPWSMHTTGCFDGTCFAMGSYISEHAGMLPALLRSKDVGKTWDFVNLINVYPQMEGYVSDITCNGNTCVLTGLFDKGKEHLLVLRSETSGSTWDDVTIIGDKGIEMDGLYDQGVTNVTYHDQQYLITGASKTKVGWSKPYILRSNDEGKTWQSATHISGFPQASSIHLGAARCAGMNCLIPGFYENSLKGEQESVLLASRDKGDTWAVTLHQDASQMTIKNLTYYHGTWFLSGAQRDHSDPAPLLMASNDEGNSWHRITLPYVANFSFGSIDQVKCEENTCYALATLTTENGRQAQGVLYQSTDQGQNWSVATVNLLPGTQESHFNDLSMK